MRLKSQADQISHTLPTTRHCCNLDVWTLVRSRGDGHRSLFTPERVLNEYEDFLYASVSHTGTGISLFKNCYRTLAHEKFYIIEEGLMNL